MFGIERHCPAIFTWATPSRGSIYRQAAIRLLQRVIAANFQPWHDGAAGRKL